MTDLETENARLRAELAAERSNVKQANGRAHMMREYWLEEEARKDAALANVARLREALVKAREYLHFRDRCDDLSDEGVQALAAIAAVLEETAS